MTLGLVIPDGIVVVVVSLVGGGLLTWAAYVGKNLVDLARALDVAGERLSTTGERLAELGRDLAEQRVQVSRLAECVRQLESKVDSPR